MFIKKYTNQKWCSSIITKCSHLCNHLPGQEMEHYQHPRSSLPAPLSLCVLLSPKATTILTSNDKGFFFFFKHHIMEWYNMYSVSYDFLYSTWCFGNSASVLCTAAVHLFDCCVIFHHMTKPQFLHWFYYSEIFGFGYNWRLLQIVLGWMFWHMSFGAYLCMDFLLGGYPGMKLLGHRLYECSVLRNNAK